jgi:plastocyanin
MTGRRLGVAGVALVIVGVVLIGASTVLASNPQAGGPAWFGGMMGGDGHGQGMMGGYAGGPAFGNGPQPGDTGFVAGTGDTPRVIRVIAGPWYTFTPSDITVQRGETITFEVTTMGPLVHEFMVGPTAAVAGDREGTPEVADIGMMQTKSLTYTFDGDGPFAFACHAPGHYEAGMKGTITVVS